MSTSETMTTVLPIPTRSASLQPLELFSGKRQEPRFGQYILGQTLGEGEFGKVKLGWLAKRKDNANDVQVAVKLIRRDFVGNSKSKLSKVEREINVLKRVNHPNIVKCYEVVETDKYIGIVLEYASGGELFEHILAHRYLKDAAACRLFAQLVSAVLYLHGQGIVHRDLKLENLLLDRNRNIVVTDFGFANTFDIRQSSDSFAEQAHNYASSKGQIRGDLMKTSCGSPCYAAPELVVSEGQYCGRKVDVWSCGVILYAMLAGYLPFDDDPANPEGDNINLLYKYIVSTPLTFPEYVSPLSRDLLRRILVPDPSQRASLRDVVAHNWLQPHARLVLALQSTTQATESRGASQEMLRSASERSPQRATGLPVDNHLVSAGFDKHDRIDVATQAMRPPSNGQEAPSDGTSSSPVTKGHSRNQSVASQVATLAIPAGPGLARSASHSGSRPSPGQANSVPGEMPAQLGKGVATKLPVPRGKPRPTSYHPQHKAGSMDPAGTGDARMSLEQGTAQAQARVGSSGSANSRHSYGSWSRNSVHLAIPTGSSPKSTKTNAPGEIYSSPQKPARATESKARAASVALPSVTQAVPQRAHKRNVSSISSMTAVLGRLWPPDTGRTGRRGSSTLADIGETPGAPADDLEAQTGATASKMPRSSTFGMLSNRLSLGGYFETDKTPRNVLGESNASNIQQQPRPAPVQEEGATYNPGHARKASSAKKFFNLFGKKRSPRESSLSQV